MTDLAWNVAAVVRNKQIQRRWGPDEMTSPATLERTCLREVRREAATAMPGAVVRRHLLWRYLLTWDKPGPPAA
jgi:hypothetical protein